MKNKKQKAKKKWLKSQYRDITEQMKEETRSLKGLAYLTYVEEKHNIENTIVKLLNNRKSSMEICRCGSFRN